MVLLPSGSGSQADFLWDLCLRSLVLWLSVQRILSLHSLFCLVKVVLFLIFVTLQNKRSPGSLVGFKILCTLVPDLSSQLPEFERVLPILR